jgi:hypothetical protein
MSLEEKLAALKLDDVSSVIDIVKKEGAEKSGLAANISVLAARCDSADEDEAIASLNTAKELAIQCPEVQAFVKDCLPACTFMNT